MARQSGGPEELLQTELQELLDAEKQLVRALPKMAKSAEDQELEEALREHLEITKAQVDRLSEIFESMDMRLRSRPCKGMRGIVEEGSEMLGSDFEGELLDSAITGSARKVEHYEIAGYESARALAQQLGRRDAVELLDKTLREEVEADRRLSQISKRLAKSRPSMMERQEPARSTGRSAGKKTSSSRGRTASRGGRKVGRLERTLTDHDEIREWAEERGAVPSCVKGTGRRGDVGMIRLDFPGYSGEESLQEVSWDDWFEKFDERNLQLIVQDETAGGRQSNFNKLISRGSASGRGRARAAR